MEPRLTVLNSAAGRSRLPRARPRRSEGPPQAVPQGRGADPARPASSPLSVGGWDCRGTWSSPGAHVHRASMRAAATDTNVAHPQTIILAVYRWCRASGKSATRCIDSVLA